MKVYISDGYIVCYGNGAGGNEITPEEEAELFHALDTKPMPTETTDYKLKDDYSWEAYEVPPPEPVQATSEDYEAALAQLGVNTNDQD